MTEQERKSPEQAQGVNLAEVRQQIVAAYTDGEISADDVNTFAELLRRQVSTGSVSPSEQRLAQAGRIAEKAFLDVEGVVTTPGDLVKAPPGESDQRSASGGGRVNN